MKFDHKHDVLQSKKSLFFIQISTELHCWFQIFILLWSPVLPEGLGWKSPLYLSKIPTCPHQIFLPKIPTFCKNFPTFFKKSNNFLKKIPTFCYNFPTFLKNLTIFEKNLNILQKTPKISIPTWKKWSPPNPSKSPRWG